MIITMDSILCHLQLTCSRRLRKHVRKHPKNLFNPFSHMTILQQTNLNIFCQEIENLYNWLDNLWLKVENIVSKAEIARFEQFLLLSLCFQKAVCCIGVRKHLYEGKGLNEDTITEKVENISTDREIACFELFLLLPTCFPKSCLLQKATKLLYMWVNKIMESKLLFFPIIHVFLLNLTLCCGYSKESSY